MLRWALALLGTVGAAVPGTAQQIYPRYEETVVVTAATPQEKKDLSQAVDVVGREEIESRQATSVAELLATLPGVSVVQSGPAGQVTSLFLRGAESDQTLVLWNGIELNDPYFGGFNWAFLPADGVERVEVVRGPASALYGSNALGGVVQVVTDPRPGVALSLEGGAHAYGRLGLAGGGRRGRVQLDFAGHLRRGDSELANGFFDSQGGLARLRWQLDPGLTVGLVGRLEDAATGVPFAGGQPSPNRRLDWRESQVALPFDATRERWTLAAQVSRVDLASRFHDPDDAFGFAYSASDSKALRGRAAASWRRDERLELVAGGDWERLETSDDSSFGPSLQGARQRTWAAFGQARLVLAQVAVEAGLRRDANDVYGSHTSPRLGLVWAVAGDTRLRASAGEGFRAPSLGELYFPGSGDPGLQPETSRSYELGVDHRIGAWLLSLVGFDTRQRNLIDFDFATFRNVNVGRTRSRGLELAVALDRGMVSSRLAANYLDAEDLETGLALLRRPRLSGSWVLGLHPAAPWSLSLVSRYQGARADVDPATFGRATSGGFAVFDLAARYRATARLAPYARVENAADRHYQEALGFPAEGRRLIGGLAVTL